MLKMLLEFGDCLEAPFAMKTDEILLEQRLVVLDLKFGLLNRCREKFK
jgi:hypothetical protein